FAETETRTNSNATMVYAARIDIPPLSSLSLKIPKVRGTLYQCTETGQGRALWLRIGSDLPLWDVDRSAAGGGASTVRACLNISSDFHCLFSFLMFDVAAALAAFINTQRREDQNWLNRRRKRLRTNTLTVHGGANTIAPTRANAVRDKTDVIRAIG